jgi:hypothetical protein
VAAARLAGRALALPHALDLLRTPENPTQEELRRVLEENFRRISDWVRPFGGGVPEPYQLARLLGGSYVTGNVIVASDVAFEHRLGRIPGQILLSSDLAGTGGRVLGSPGGGGAGGSNSQPWTNARVFVRATVDSEYAFILI